MAVKRKTSRAKASKKKTKLNSHTKSKKGCSSAKNKSKKKTKKTGKVTSNKTKKHSAGRHPNQLKNLKSYKKGQSGNPKGRPKGSRNFRSIIGDILNRGMTGKELDELINPVRNQKNKTALEKARAKHLMILAEDYGKITYREAMVLAQTLKATRGDTQAFNALADREEGKPRLMIGSATITYEEFLDGLDDLDDEEDE